VSALTEISEPNGLEILEGILDGRFPPPNTALLLGMKLVEIADGRTVFEFVSDERARAGTCAARGASCTSGERSVMPRPP
jgi:hypothetical protein